MLLQAKGWTTVVVISLALGIGANTALFSAINGLLLKKIPVQDPDSLVRLRWNGKNDMVTSSSDYGFSAKDEAGREIRTTFSYPMYKQFLADNRTMTDLLACAPFGRVSVVVDGQAEIADAFISTGNYYRVLGINALLGRTLVPDDDNPSAPPAALISARYWRSRFGSDPASVGKVIRINNVPVTIVGVLPPSFTGIQQAVSNGHDVLVPLSLDGQLSTGPAAPSPRVSQPTYWWLQVMGRLKPGVSATQVRGNLEGIFQQTARAGLNSYLSSITDAERSTMRNRNRKEVPNLRVDSGSRGIYDREHERQTRGHNPQHCRRPRSPHRLRQCRESVAVTRSRQTKGNLGSLIARRDAMAIGAAAPDGEFVAGVSRRCAWRRDWPLGQAAAARASR